MQILHWVKAVKKHFLKQVVSTSVKAVWSHYFSQIFYHIFKELEKLGKFVFKMIRKKEKKAF